MTLAKEARYVVRLSNDRSYTPVDQPTLLQRVRDCVRPSGGQAMNLRVSHGALEFDLFISENREIKPFLTELQRIGPALTWVRLNVPTGLIVPPHLIEQAISLFNEERYWEAHELLEGLWKLKQGQEKQLLQGLILTAAALVHVQKNELKPVVPMLQDAARRLENQPPNYFGLSIHEFLNHLQHMISQQTWNFPSI